MVAIDAAVVGGHRFRGEERQARDLVPGEPGDHRGRDPRIGPLQFLAPVRPHRQRHHHIAQQHRHVHRRVRHQREPERAKRMRADVQRDREVALHRVAKDPFPDHDRQHRGVQRDDLARPVDQHVPVLGRQLSRPGITLPGPARAEPFPPCPAKRVVTGDLGLGAEPLADVLPDHVVLGPHRHLRPAQRLLTDREDCLPDLLSDRRVAAALPQPPIVGAADQPEPPSRVLPSDQRAIADGIQAQQFGLLLVYGLQLSHLGQAAAGQRRGVRVVLGLRLAWAGSQPVSTAETRRHLQQMDHPQPSELPLALLQVPHGLGLTTPVRACGGRPGGRPATGVVGKKTEAHPLAGAIGRDQLHMPQVRLTPLDGPLHSVQHQFNTGRQIQHTGSRHHFAAPCALTTIERSASGSARSTPSRRCQIRCNS